MKLLRRLKQGEQGFTLVEQLVVIAMASFLSLGFFWFVLSLFGAWGQGQSGYARTTTSYQINSFLGEQFAVYPVWRNDLGLRAPASSDTLTVSMAGDQLFLENEKGCARIFYVSRTKQLRAATSKPDACDSIKPVRGPNEAVVGQTGCASPCYTVSDVADPLYDPVLDVPSASFILAERVVLSPAGATTVDDTNQPIEYFDALNRPLTFIPAQARIGTFISSTKPIQSLVDGIVFSFYLQSSITQGSGATAPKLYKLEQFPLGS